MKKSLMKSLFLFSRKDKFSNKLIVVITWLLLVVIIGCVIQLGFIYHKYKSADNTQKDLLALATSTTSTVSKEPSSTNTSGDITSEVEEFPFSATSPQMNFNFNSLAEINSDIVGWILLEGSAINYPVMQTYDNDKYLHTEFYGSYHALGTIFADYRAGVTDEDRSDNITLYGHNAKNGSFFAGLLKYKSLEYYQANPYIDWYTPEHPNGERYVVVSAFVESADASIEGVFQYNDFVNASDEEHFDWFMKRTQEDGDYIHNNVDVSYGDKLLTLSTCDFIFDNARFVIVARKLRPDDDITQFKFW